MYCVQLKDKLKHTLNTARVDSEFSEVIIGSVERSDHNVMLGVVRHKYKTLFVVKANSVSTCKCDGQLRHDKVHWTVYWEHGQVGFE